MKATDLRIGNWVSIYGTNQKVTCLNVPFAVLTRTNGLEGSMPGVYADISGIPLTEEILLKCGLVLHTVKMPLVNWDDYRIGNMVLNKTDIGFEVEFGSNNFSIEERTNITSVQYLHQLQNLYYALTGKELTVNL